MKSLCLFGVGLDSSEYQLGVVYSSFASAFPSTGNTFYPVLFLALREKVTGRLLRAADMPVTITPGFLQQGEKDKYGDKAVFHGKATGEIVPDEVRTTLSAAFTQCPTDPSQCMFVNNSDITKNKFFASGYSTYSTSTRWRFQWPSLNSFSEVLGGSTYGGTIDREILGDNLIVKIHILGYYQESYITHTIPLSFLEFESSLNRGTTVRRTRVLHPTGSWSTVSSASLLAFKAFSAPTRLDHLTKEVIFSGSGKNSLNQLNADLMSVSQISAGNAPFLSCYNAVESVKHINFQWAAYIRDSLDVKSLISPLKNFRKGKAKPKFWADLFLWWIYGIKPQYGDTKKLIEKLSFLKTSSIFEVAELFSKVHSKYGTSYTTGSFVGNSVTIKCNSRVRLQPRLQPINKAEILFLFLQSLDIGIDATSVWELLPYSFVVDWFINTDEYAKWMTYKNYPSLYNLRQLILSKKHTVRVPSTRYVYGSVSEPVTLTTYQRGLHTTFPKLPYELAFNDPSGHWLEGAALLISKS